MKIAYDNELIPLISTITWYLENAHKYAIIKALITTQANVVKCVQVGCTNHFKSFDDIELDKAPGLPSCLQIEQQLHPLMKSIRNKLDTLADDGTIEVTIKIHDGKVSRIHFGTSASYMNLEEVGFFSGE